MHGPLLAASFTMSKRPCLTTGRRSVTTNCRPVCHRRRNSRATTRFAKSRSAKPGEPIVGTIRGLAQPIVDSSVKKSALGCAILYSINRWQALMHYCDDGRIEIDNAAAECASRRDVGSQELFIRRFECRQLTSGSYL